MQSLCSSKDAMALLDHMETQYYERQLQLYDIQGEILQCEELLLSAQLDSIRRQMSGILAEFTSYFCNISVYETSPSRCIIWKKTLPFPNDSYIIIISCMDLLQDNLN